MAIQRPAEFRKLLKKPQSISADPASLSSQFEHIAATVVASGGLVPKPWLVQRLV
jgi:hypothetical protein